MKETVWCILCGKRFTDEEIKGAGECPACGDDGIPCSTDRDFLLEINWHELHILCVWAENWASKIGTGQDTVNAIARRLQSQVKGQTPLTLSGEIHEIRLQPEIEVLETNIDKSPLLPVYGPGAVGHSNKPTK